MKKNGRPPKDRTGSIPGTRICDKCQQSVPLEFFSKDSTRYDKLRVTCKKCDQKAHKAWRDANPEKYAEKNRRNLEAKNTWARNNREQSNARVRSQKRKERKALIDRYGGKCACCGEDRIEFLAIDHVDGGGTQHREKVGKGERFYGWLRKQGFPDGFRILCHNCNLAIGFYGYCPHALPSYDKNTYINGDIPSPIRSYYAKRSAENNP